MTNLRTVHIFLTELNSDFRPTSKICFTPKLLNLINIQKSHVIADHTMFLKIKLKTDTGFKLNDQVFVQNYPVMLSYRNDSFVKTLILKFQF